ncbi:L-type lectin-domain containing receptor kinase VIII.1-like [Cryptomeria japonica]|uniref:L-type lectin-domain containing receptor kinase VIII.1-like n=1 Tax=Cryptomeria japonica TaxID=3369 RepID=UPI0027D9D864|nr:L-type lectin-domain containing receptor kinase VIII.1-like [Cryptomeria japonica]
MVCTTTRLSRNGKKWEAWVDYDGIEVKLKVFISFNPNGTDASKPRTPFLLYDIDLRQLLPHNVQVGLSASTGNSIETYTVYMWNFSCQYSWETSIPGVNASGRSPKNKRKSFEKIIWTSGVACFLVICCFNRARKSKRGDAGKDGEESDEEFNKRFDKLTHHNLLKFLGWCHRKGDLLLAYKLLPNGSLDKYIFENPETPLEWGRRYSIACDIASALVYLHEDRHESFVHRDIKASNVMLDSNFKAKLGDFCLARMVERGEGGHTTTAAGTIGYIAREFAATGKATREMDVLSYGALSLEIACGRRPADWSLIDHNSRVVEWVWHLHRENIILDAADKEAGLKFQW